MKISEIIENLQEFMAEHGDIECWYAKDNEGNGHQKVCYIPGLYYVDEDGEVYTSLEDAEDCGLDAEDVKPICVVN